MYPNSISHITSSVHADRGHEQAFPAERQHPSPLRSSGLVGMITSLALLVLLGLVGPLPVAGASSGPTLYLPPSPLVVNATSSLGALVFYNVTATDPNFSQLTITCSPPSGSNFPVGTTIVRCQARNPRGAVTTGFFQVIVQDTTAPTLYLPPSPLIANATSSLGAIVFYNVSATDPDNFSSQLSISCTFPSGSNFPVGTTTVSCQASDPSGNTTTGFFEVVVQQTSF